MSENEYATSCEFCKSYIMFEDRCRNEQCLGKTTYSKPQEDVLSDFDEKFLHLRKWERFEGEVESIKSYIRSKIQIAYEKGQNDYQDMIANVIEEKVAPNGLIGRGDEEIKKTYVENE